MWFQLRWMILLLQQLRNYSQGDVVSSDGATSGTSLGVNSMTSKGDLGKTMAITAYGADAPFKNRDKNNDYASIKKEKKEEDEEFQKKASESLEPKLVNYAGWFPKQRKPICSHSCVG